MDSQNKKISFQPNNSFCFENWSYKSLRCPKEHTKSPRGWAVGEGEVQS